MMMMMMMIIVKRLQLLPGVTTLFRDFAEGLSLVPLITLALLPFSVAWNNFNCWSEKNRGKHSKAFYLPIQNKYV